MALTAADVTSTLTLPTATDTPLARSKILDLSRLTEEVLLLLLTGQAELNQRLQQEKEERDKQAKDIKDKVDRENTEIREK